MKRPWPHEDEIEIPDAVFTVSLANANALDQAVGQVFGRYNHAFLFAINDNERWKNEANALVKKLNNEVTVSERHQLITTYLELLVTRNR
jgi:hypothetical protein